MLINSLLACFILLSNGAGAECVNGEQDEKVQEQQDQTSQKEYIPTVIYFTTNDLATTVETPEIKKAETKDIVQIFVITRDQ